MKNSEYPYPKICPVLTSDQCDELLTFARKSKGVDVNVLDLETGYYKDDNLRSATSWMLPENLNATMQIRAFIESQSGLPRVN
jgi:hypothetical protein